MKANTPQIISKQLPQGENSYCSLKMVCLFRKTRLLQANRCLKGSAISNRLKSYCTKFPFNNSDSNMPVESMEMDDTTLLVTCGQEGNVINELVEVPSETQTAKMSSSTHSSLGRSQSLDDNLHVLSSQADTSNSTVSKFSRHLQT